MIVRGWPCVATVSDVATQFNQRGKSLSSDRELRPPVMTVIVVSRQGLATTRPGKRSPARATAHVRLRLRGRPSAPG